MSSRSTFGVGVCALIVTLLCTSARIIAQQPESVAATFSKRSTPEKRAMMNDLAAHRVSPAPADLGDLLRAGIGDENAEVRAAALWAVAGRAGGARFSPVAKRAEKVELLRSERTALLPLRSAVRAKMTDPDERVRRAALAAAGNLEFDPAVSSPRAVTLDPDFAKALITMFKAEQSAGLRVEIVKAFALLSAEQTTAIRQDSQTMLLAALQDPDADVVAYAALGIGNQKIAAGLPRAIGLLSHERRNVRLFAAQAIAGFGEAAGQYAPQLEQALASERDEIVVKTLRGTLEKIRSK